MAKCENCYHKDVCNGRSDVEAFGCKCEDFKDKSLIVEPPCKVGDLVWFLHSGFELLEARIISIEDNYYTNPQIWITVEFFSKLIGTNTYKSRIDLMLGKTVFLSREKAERALREREKNE